LNVINIKFKQTTLETLGLMAFSFLAKAVPLLYTYIKSEKGQRTACKAWVYRLILIFDLPVEERRLVLSERSESKEAFTPNADIQRLP
jgi:hypothetical protein